MNSSCSNETNKKEYNKAFFGLWEKVFIELKNEYGTKQCLLIARKIMEKSLADAYDATGFKKGKPEEFSRILKLRDNDVGLDVDFPIVTENEIVYDFKTDPFPNLKNDFSVDEIYSTFIPFKIKYILGDNWNYKITKNIWNKDKFTEIVITKEK